METNQKWVLVRLQDMMTVWTDVVNEFRENQGGEYVEFVLFIFARAGLMVRNSALIYWVQPEDDTEAPATPETSRRKAVSFSCHGIFFSSR